MQGINMNVLNNLSNQLIELYNEKPVNDYKIVACSELFSFYTTAYVDENKHNEVVITELGRLYNIIIDKLNKHSYKQIRIVNAIHN